MHEDVYRMYIKIPSFTKKQQKRKNIDFYHQIENVLENEKIFMFSQVQAGNNR